MKSEYFVTELLSDQLHIRTCINGLLQSHLSVKYPCPPSLHSFAKRRCLFSTKSIQNTKKTPMNEDLVKTWRKYYSYLIQNSVIINHLNRSCNWIGRFAKSIANRALWEIYPFPVLSIVNILHTFTATKCVFIYYAPCLRNFVMEHTRALTFLYTFTSAVL